MNAPIRWWSGLARRERLLVGAAAVLAALTLAQLAAGALGGGLDSLRAELEATRTAAAIARGLAAAPAADAPPEPLLAAADRAARAAGLGQGLKRLAQDDDGSVRVRLEGVALGGVARFLGDVQRGAGARIAALLVARGDGPGTVDVTLTLLPPG